MDTLASLDEEILSIFDEPEPARAPRRRWRNAGVIGLAGVVGLAVVVSVVAAVLSLVHESRRTQCFENLRRIGAGFHKYEEAQAHFPAPALADRDGKPLLSWRVALLPSMGYQSLYQRFHLDEPWDSPHNRALLAEMPSEFACPEGPGRRAGQTGYLVVVGPKTEVGSINTPFEPTRGAALTEIFDGTSNTLHVMETNVLVPWTKPEDLHWAPGEPPPKLASPHAGGANVLFIDGSARFVKSTITAQILIGLLTINGGEVLSSS